MTAPAAAPLPLQDPAAVDALASDLRAAGYDADGVPRRLGPAGAALGRGEYWAAHRATTGGTPLDTLVRLFLLGAVEPADAVAAALPATGIDRAVADGIVEWHGHALRAALDIRPHADATNGYLVISDLDSDVRPGPLRPDHVLGIGAASVSLANAVIRRPVETALDLGTGCGIQALHLTGHAEQVVATDVNPRALALAGATAAINGMHWDLRTGSLFEPVAGQRFDLIVSNPPFVIGDGATQYTYRDSGMAGDEICRRIVTELPDHLAPGGTAQLLANWMVCGEQDWREPVAGWVAGTGCDAWVVQREFADPTRYISLWLADTGERPDEIPAKAQRWADWFDEHRVRGIGMGVITLRRKARGDSSGPDQVFDEITGPGEEVTGPEADAFLARRRFLAATDTAALLATRLSLADGAMLSERSLPGIDGWSPVLRMLTRPGPGATVQLDQWTRALFAGCRGEVTLGTQLELLATANGVDLDALTTAALPSVTAAIGRGLVHPVDGPAGGRT